MGSKSYIGPKVKEEACCELDEVLTGAGGGAGGAGEGGSGNGGVVVEVSLSGLGLVWFEGSVGVRGRPLEDQNIRRAYGS